MINSNMNWPKIAMHDSMPVEFLTVYATDCGETPEDARGQAKQEIDRIVNKGKSLGSRPFEPQTILAPVIMQGPGGVEGLSVKFLDGPRARTSAGKRKYMKHIVIL